MSDVKMDVIFQQEEAFICDFTEDSSFEVSFGGESFRPEQYDGNSEVTPTTITQTLETKGKLVVENITIKPIPNNYGLITWNGSTLTVS